MGIRVHNFCADSLFLARAWQERYPQSSNSTTPDDASPEGLMQDPIICLPAKGKVSLLIVPPIG